MRPNPNTPDLLRTARLLIHQKNPNRTSKGPHVTRSSMNHGVEDDDTSTTTWCAMSSGIKAGSPTVAGNVVVNSLYAAVGGCAPAPGLAIVGDTEGGCVGLDDCSVGDSGCGQTICF